MFKQKLRIQLGILIVFIFAAGILPFSLTADEPRKETAIHSNPSASCAIEAQVKDKKLEKQLNKLRTFIEEKREHIKMPGLAVGVVKDGEVIFAEGFGSREVNKDLPVDSQTVFQIGSSTKAFTATGLAMLVEKGIIEWDEPVRTFLPTFAVKDEFISNRITVRDLVTHRSGLARHEPMWYGNSWTRAELVSRIKHLDLNADLRERFQYNNLMFAAAGYLIGQMTDSTWEEFTRDRIFKPLGMTRSNFSNEESRSQENIAFPHNINDDAAERIDFMPISSMGPAGSIDSCIDDMLKWVQFNLNSGKTGEKQLLSQPQHRELVSPQMFMTTPMYAMIRSLSRSYQNYGMGWMLETYHGHRMVHHGGNVTGGTSQVAFLPDDNIGMVIFSNAGSLFPTTLSYYLIDLLTGNEPLDLYPEVEEFLKRKQRERKEDRVEGTHPSHPLEEYVGEYENAGYGILTVTLAEETLTAKYKISESPLGYFHYNIFKSKKPLGFAPMKLTFQVSEKGKISSVSVPFEATVAPIKFTKIEKKQ